MKLEIVTIVLDGMPCITWHLPVLERLTIPWTWHIVEGVAAPVKDTAWCKSMPARLSRDGTTEFLNGLRSHPRIKIYQKQLWPGKAAMFNEALRTIREPCVLLQCDSDEIWTTEQLIGISNLFHGDQRNCARFWCRYWIGSNIIAIGNDCWSNQSTEWLRAFKFQPGMRFETHEPPKIQGMIESCIPKEVTLALRLSFQHFAYAFESQVRLKESYYGYKNAVLCWNSLQRHRQWPLRRLKDYFPWVDDRVGADLVYRP
jgi:hypothetical protein